MANSEKVRGDLLSFFCTEFSVRSQTSFLVCQCIILKLLLKMSKWIHLKGKEMCKLKWVLSTSLFFFFGWFLL